MKKVLLAVGFRQLEEYIEKQLRKEFLFVEPTTYREGVIRNVGQRNPDIIVIRETLSGNENILSIVYELRQRYSNKRIIFIGGNREAGDALLASLVSMNVFDILYGKKVKAQDIIALIRKPNEYKDVQNLQPKPVFDDKTNKVLFEAPDHQEREVIKEVIKEVYVENEVKEPSIPTPKEPSPKPLEIEKEKIPVLPKPTEEIPVKEIEPEVKEDKPKADEKKALPKPKHKNPKPEKPTPEPKEKRGLLDFISGVNPSEMRGSQKILTFMGGKNGVGNTSIAFNTALQLAEAKHKVLFMELDDRTPSVAYWYALGEDVDNGIDKAIGELTGKNYSAVEESIIKSKDIKLLDTPFKKNYKKFPDSLDFMFFSSRYLTRQSIDNLHIEEAVTRDLYLHLLFQLQYDYIVLDVSPDIWNESTLNALMYSHKVFLTVTQDVSTIGNALYLLNELGKSGVHIEKKINYIINKYEKADLTQKAIEEWVNASGTITVPLANKEFVNANYHGLPVLLGARHAQLKQAFQRIEKTI